MEHATVTEECPHCGYENDIRWDVKEMGITAYCSCCGNAILICSECSLLEDGGCDWSYLTSCSMYNPLIALETFPEIDDFYATKFAVRKKWLWGKIKGSYKSIDDFLSSYIWDTTFGIYNEAKSEKQLVYEYPIRENEKGNME